MNNVAASCKNNYGILLIPCAGITLGLTKEYDLHYADLDEDTAEGKDFIVAVHDAALSSLGYFLKLSELFHNIAKKDRSLVEKEDDAQGNGASVNDKESSNFILFDLDRILNNIEQSTLRTDSADDFINLFEDMDSTSSKKTGRKNGMLKTPSNATETVINFHDGIWALWGVFGT